MGSPARRHHGEGTLLRGGGAPLAGARHGVAPRRGCTPPSGAAQPDLAGRGVARAAGVAYGAARPATLRANHRVWAAPALLRGARAGGARGAAAVAAAD